MNLYDFFGWLVIHKDHGLMSLVTDTRFYSNHKGMPLHKWVFPAQSANGEIVYINRDDFKFDKSYEFYEDYEAMELLGELLRTTD